MNIRSYYLGAIIVGIIIITSILWFLESHKASIPVKLKVDNDIGVCQNGGKITFVIDYDIHGPAFMQSIIQ